ncbi:MAG: sigma-70 family RNA polymerase sigma factor [Planctomycetes bacterium]|nr:sigma-70 family RNA polymerase sigma factor [Planctomycetota bacterium]
MALFACTGDRRAFDELASLAGPFLNRRASAELTKRRLPLDPGEVVQEALLNIYRYAKSFRPTVPHAFATWSSRIVANVVLRMLRPRKKPRPLSIEDLDGVELRAPVRDDPVRRIGDAEERQALCASMTLWLQCYYVSYLGLTDLQKRILHRVEIVGESYSEIAADLGMRVEAVKMVVYRGRKKLQQDMDRLAAS